MRSFVLYVDSQLNVVHTLLANSTVQCPVHMYQRVCQSHYYGLIQ